MKGKKTTPPAGTFKKTLLEPESVEPDVLYTFTINYAIEDNRANRNKSFFETFHDQSRAIYDIKHCNYKIYPELSRVGKLHWHGNIMFKNYAQIALFYAIELPRLMKIAQIEIDTIADTDKWTEYIMKGRKYMTQLCTKIKADYEHTNMEPSEALGEGESLE